MNLKRDTRWEFFMEVLLFQFYLIAVLAWIICGLILRRVGLLSDSAFYIVTVSTGLPYVFATVVNIVSMAKILRGK